MPENGYSDAELAAMMVDLESDLVERKRSLSTSASEKISRSICALANDLPGHGRPGVVFVGVEDDGRCSGLTIDVSEDENCLATLKHYRSLMPYAQEARKPMFKLTSADGAIGGHINAVQDCYWDFRRLACAVAKRCGVTCPQL